MLTDEEKREIIDQYLISDNAGTLHLIEMVERAVLAKAGEQEPAIHIRDNGEVEYNPEYNGSIYGDFYAHQLPAQAIPEWTDEQCAEFISIALRNVDDMTGILTFDDIRHGCTFANKLSASPNPNEKARD